MKYAAEVGSGAMTYIPSFLKIGSGAPKLIGKVIHRQTTRRSHKPVFVFQNKKSRLKMQKAYTYINDKCTHTFKA
jgi:hypothetical protein